MSWLGLGFIDEVGDAGDRIPNLIGHAVIDKVIQFVGVDHVLDRLEVVLQVANTSTKRFEFLDAVSRDGFRRQLASQGGVELGDE